VKHDRSLTLLCKFFLSPIFEFVGYFSHHVTVTCRAHTRNSSFPCCFLLRNFCSLLVYKRLTRNKNFGCPPNDPFWTMGMCCISSLKFFTASTHVYIMFDILSLLDIFVAESRNRHYDRFLSEYSGFTLSLSFLECSILTLIYLSSKLCNLSHLRHWKTFLSCTLHSLKLSATQFNRLLLRDFLPVY
jgi:hypothetical protein